MGNAQNSDSPVEVVEGGPLSTKKATLPMEGKATMPFVTDIEPFFYGRPITYVDVGAYRGAVFQALLTSSLRVRAAHLIEPNPKSYHKLQRSIESVTSTRILQLHNVAIASTTGDAVMVDEESMSHLVPNELCNDIDQGQNARLFNVKTIRLDDLLRANEVHHINLLKIDVEGAELDVLTSASSVLSAQAVDFLYIEVGLDPESRNLTYYREVEDFLRPLGYRMHHIYEQMHEWISDAPVLRRANISFISENFAKHNPFRVSQELFQLKRDHGSLLAEIEQLRIDREHLNKLRAVHDELVAENCRQQGEHESLKKAIAEAERENFALKDELSKLRMIHDELVAENCRQRGARESLETALAEAQRENFALKDELNDFRVDQAQASRELSELRADLSGLEADIAKLQALRVAAPVAANRDRVRVRLEREIKQLRERNDRLLKSTSWRVTAPLRHTALLIRSLRKGRA